MSELTTLARPYANAVFELAREQGEYDKWSQMLAFMSAVAHDGTMRALLDSPRLDEEQAAELFISVCKEQIDEQGQNFVKLLAENRRIALLPEITALYEFMRSEAEGRISAEVVSAQDITPSQIQTIAKALKARLGREVNVTTRTDKSLLGGAIIRAGDLVIDGSIRGRLNQLSTALSH